MLKESDILTFTLLILDLFCMWEGFSGFFRNIMRIEKEKSQEGK